VIKKILNVNWVIGNPCQVRHLGHLNVPNAKIVIFLRDSIIELDDTKQDLLVFFTSLCFLDIFRKSIITFNL
jgi:hypothetical protein